MSSIPDDFSEFSVQKEVAAQPRTRLGLFSDFTRGFLQPKTRLFDALSHAYVLFFSRIRKVQVHVIRGLAKNTDKTLKIVFVGNELDANQFCSVTCSHVHEMCSLGSVPYSEVDRLLARISTKPNLIVVHQMWPFVETFKKHNFLIVPTVSFRLSLKGSSEEIIARMSRRRRRDLRKIGECCFSHTVHSGDDAVFNYFYWKMHVPFVKRRFGKAAHIRSYDEVRYLYRHNGGIIFLKHDGRPVTAILFQIRGKALYALNFGAAQNNAPSQNEDVSGQAVLYYLIQWAKQNGMESLDYGVSLSFFRDGIFRYKREWGMGLTHRTEFFNWALKISCVSGACPNFLTNNPFIVLDQEALKGLFFLDHKPSTAELNQIYLDNHLPGLESIITLAYYKLQEPAKTPDGSDVECHALANVSPPLQELCQLMHQAGYETEVFEIKKPFTGNNQTPASNVSMSANPMDAKMSL